MFLYIPKSICLVNNQLILLLVASILALLSPQSDRVQDMILVVPDLLIQVVECRYPAVACPPKPVFKVGFCLFDISRF